MPTLAPNYEWPDLKSPLDQPKILEFALEHNSTFPAFVYPEQGTGNLSTISTFEYVRAIYRVGKAVLRPESKPGDVVAIIANVDNIVYMALINGLMNVGLVPFPISPRNSAPAVVNLLRKSSAHRILTTQATLKGILDSVRSELESESGEHFELSVEEAPNLEQVYPYLGKETAQDAFDGAPTPYYPSDTETALYLHSSGSTGFPKAIRFSHLNFKSYIHLLCLQDFRDLKVGPMGAAGLPPFHVMAFFNQGFVPLYGRVTVAMFSPAVTTPDALPLPLTPDNVLENIRLTKSNALLTVPTFLLAWSHSDEAVELLAQCIAVLYAGGPLPQRAGDYLVSRGVQVVTAYGGTEFGLIVKTVVSPEDWPYLQFVDGVNVRWAPQGDGTFEAQFLTQGGYQPALENLPDTRGYASSDLFVPHPTDPKKWKIVGRLDDVITHSTGEKTVPAPMEAVITATPLIQGAVMFGRERAQTGILVEPSPQHQIDVKDLVQVAALRNSLWPLVDEANQIAPAFSRIFKEMILIASPDKPLPRVGKGTVARKAALALYESEINELYSVVESNSGGDNVDPPKAWTAEEIKPWLEEQVMNILSNRTDSVHVTKDLFEQGFDSIMATILRLHIVSALRKSSNSGLVGAREIPQTLVYNHPSIDRLTSAILGIVAGSDAGSSSMTISMQPNQHERSVAIERMIEQYSQGLEAPPPPPKISLSRQNHHVLLTGSTGNIGTELLAGLVLSDSVERVYAFNRRSSSGSSILDRHRERFEDKGLDVSLLDSSKLVFLEGDTSADDLGLSQDILYQLRQNLTIIVHNAWRLDFNLSLSSFESHIKGTRSLIDLARASRHSSNVRFLFTSSISSTQSWDASKGPYPEEVVLEAKYAVGLGYGESKYVAERVLAQSGLQATSFRIGQVAGGEPNGAWANTDWLPILVKSSLALNKLPDTHGSVSWIPMDAVTQALLDYAFLEGPAPIAVNILHPRPSSWTSVMTNIKQALIDEKKLSSDALPLISIHEWVSEIEKHASNPSDDIPAVKLLEFFNNVAKMDGSGKGENTPMRLENVKRISSRVRDLEPLDADIASKWVKYWIRTGI
ncbi:hypothetical protein D9757_011015 [Collybiopsis confluens]|uniref:Polyketide synthase-like phosphopantetheine-binding domain-containing protein n=1 Tax=Collybiopsis confluens TaxID=2823264 RepID=A0A8H5GD77_9AGAR|nr:hypothetical protein D9757_011015 [Collybiopsis confluens]